MKGWKGSMKGRRSVAVLWAVAAIVVGSTEAGAQLRPLEPLDWTVYEAGTRVVATLGLGTYSGQRASLAGAEGRLTELGAFVVSWRLDRVTFEVGGTALRLFREDRIYADPVPGTALPTGERRVDAGDFRISTILGVASGRAGRLVLRFGTRLPTTDNGVGLERDQTDFYALVGARGGRGDLNVSAEVGVGIHGTRESRSEQVDVLLYALTAELRRGPLLPRIMLLGQADGLKGPSIRGNEDLRELRIGLRIGKRRWLDLAMIRGWTEFSPESGFTISAGHAF